MSTTGTTINPCPVLQEALVRYFQTCPSANRGETPTLIWTNSPQNKSGVEQLIQPTRGKKRTVELIYEQPIPDADVQDVESCEKNCTATTKRGDEVVQLEIECTDGVWVEALIEFSDWNESCKSDGTVVMSTIKRMFDALIRKIAAKQATELNPLLGNWSSNVPDSWTDVNEFLEVATKDTAGKNDPQWFERINAAKAMTQYCGSTLITGGIDLYSAWRLLNVGCCTQDGLDALAILEQYGEAVVYDPFIAAEFGNNVSLMLQSNSIQLVNVVWNTPMLNLTGFVDLDLSYRNYFSTVLADPVSGILVDLNIKEDCGKAHLVMTGTTKTFGLPNNLYPAGHPNEFVTFANGIIVDNPAVV